MLVSILSAYPGRAAVGLGLVGAGLYLAMTGITLAHVEAVSGHAPFDMRPFGYGPAEAAELLGALGDEGRAYYLGRQIPLDTLYPTILALTLIAATAWARHGVAGARQTRVVAVLALAAATFDYAENLGIVAMILGWPDLPHGLVHAASAATVAKSAATTAAASLLLLALACRAVSRGATPATASGPDPIERG
jgi:hypothetical protein